MIGYRIKRIATGLAIMLAFIVGIGMFARFNPEEYRFFPKCPVYLLTGYKCPGCGSQRAFYHLLHGDIATAFKYNPLMLMIVLYLFFGLYLEYFMNKSHPHRLFLLQIFFGKWAALTLGIIILLFTFARNAV